MSDLHDQVSSNLDPLTKLIGKIPGFSGYVDRQVRRAADELLRATIVTQFYELWKRVTALQQEMAGAGELSYLDDLEKAAMKLQTFMDKVQGASQGYSGFFDSIKINEEELQKIYEFDAALLEMAEQLGSAIDNVSASMDTDGMPAAVRHLVSLASDVVSAFDQRDEVIKATA